MQEAQIVVIDALKSQVAELSAADPKIKKLFDKQKEFMSRYPFYNSLGRKKLENVCDQHGNPLEEIRLNMEEKESSGSNFVATTRSLVTIS